MFTFFLASFSYSFIATAIYLWAVQPLSHESMGHSRSLGYVKGFMMENVKYGREWNVTLGRAPQYYPFSLGGDNTGLGHRS
jgi:hypothetical protein